MEIMITKLLCLSILVDCKGMGRWLVFEKLIKL
jgi:hypothetical protein